MLTSQYGSLVPVGSDACKSHPSITTTVRRPSPCPRTDRAEISKKFASQNYKQENSTKVIGDNYIKIIFAPLLGAKDEIPVIAL